MKNKNGFVLIYTILIVSVMLTATLSLTRIFLPRIRATTDSISSTVAIFAADSATELCLYQARKQLMPVPLSNPLMTNGALVTIASLSAVEVDVSGDCRAMDNEEFTFRATAVYRGVTRAFQVNADSSVSVTMSTYSRNVTNNTPWGATANAVPGNQVGFRILVTPVGNTNALNIRLADTLPAGLTFISSDIQDSITQPGTSNTEFNMGNGNETRVVEILASVNSSGFPSGSTILTNTATVTSSNAGGGVGTNQIVVNN
jgi:uncharacterized repeat protein (TIGR01451 family)